MSLYRIPLRAEPGIETWLDDLDLPLLLHHSGESGALDLARVSARDSRGERLPAQCHENSKPSAIRGRQRVRLLIAPSPERQIDLVVRAGLNADLELSAASDKAKNGNVSFNEVPGAMNLMVGDNLFATYRYDTKDPDLPRPYFHPVIGPSGKTITQLGEVPGKREKHFHHTGLWLAHQNFAAKGDKPCDNWQIGKANSSRIEHVDFKRPSAKEELFVSLEERLRWLNVKGDKVLLDERRTITLFNRPEAR